MAITTKKGDLGKTSTKSFQLSKDDITIELLGTIDETIANLVVVYNLIKIEELRFIVDDLSLFASIIAGYKQAFDKNLIIKLDTKIASYQKTFNFSYPYDNYNNSIINVTRTIVRKLERTYWKYCRDHQPNQDIAAYLNRLSDYLYTFL